MVTHPASGSALITGASAGIGAIYADRLAQRGYDLILVARIEQFLRTDASITMLVNNAGIGATAPLLASDIETMASMIDLNLTALARLTYAAAPGVVAHNGGDDRRHRPVAPQRRLRWQQGLRAGLQPIAESPTDGQAHSYPGGSAGRNRYRLLGKCRHPARTSARREGDAGRRPGGCGVGRPRPGGTIPSLPGNADGNAYQAARQKLMPNLSRQLPAARHRAGDKAI